MDVIATIVLIALFDSATYGDLQMIGNAPYSPEPRADYSADDYYAFAFGVPPPLPRGQRAGDGGAVCCATVVLAIDLGHQYVCDGIRVFGGIVWTRVRLALGERGAGSRLVACGHQGDGWVEWIQSAVPSVFARW